MRWVSSDRQLADGLTKASMRQTLADKLRHAKIKFLYDPGYVAAKKKTLEEKREELESSTKTRKQKHSKNVKKPKNDFQPENAEAPENDLIPAKGDLTAELFTDEEFKMDEEHDVAQYDLVPQNAQAPVNVCYAQSFAVVKYVNARRASHGAVVNVPTLLEKFVFKTLAFLAAGLGMENIPLAQGTDVCNTPGFSADETGSNNYLSWSLLLLFLGLVILTLWFALRRSVRRLVELDYQLSTARQQIALLERDLAEAEGRQATVEDERSLVMRNSNVLSVMHGELQQAHERRTQAHDRARRAFAEQRDAEVELRNALRLSAPELQTGFEAAHALEVHFERCPLGGMISIQDGARSWHTDSDCPELYVSGREIQNRVPCPFCAQTPRDPDDLNAGLRVIHAPDGVQLENLRAPADQ